MNLGPDVGPFPVGVWAGLAGVGVLGGLAIRRAGWFDNPEPAPVLDAGDSSTVLQPGQRISPGAIILPGTPGTTTPSTVDTKPTTNSKWATQVINLLISKGYTGSVADTAIRKYLQGSPLGPPEIAVVNEALASPLGPPPEGAPPIKTTTTSDDPTNPVPSGPLPAEARKRAGTLGENVTTVQKKPSGKGETPREIALRVYGQPEQWNYLRFFNPQTIGADGKAPLRVGLSINY